MAGFEGAARHRREAVVSRAAAVAVGVGIATYLRVRTTVLPPAASSAVVTARSQLAPEVDATDEACRAGRGDALPAAVRSATVSPGRVDLIGLARWEDSRVEPFPDVKFEVVRAQGGAPVPGAEFVATLWPPRGHGTREECMKLAGRADERGRFTIRTAQEFDLAVHATGLGWQAARIDRGRAEAREILSFELSESLVLDVRVVGPDGAPQPGAWARAFGIEKTNDFSFHGACGNAIVQWSTDLGSAGTDGRLEEVECLRGRRIGFIVGTDEGSWLLPSIVLDDAPGARRSVELAIPPLVRVVGSVLQADGTPVKYSRLRFERRFDAWGGVDKEFNPDEDGRYAATLEHPGPYRVEFWTESDEFVWIVRETRDVFVPAGETNIDFIDPDPAPPSRSGDGVEEGSPSGLVRGKVVCSTVSNDPPIDFRRGCALLLRNGRVDAYAQLEEDGTFERKDLCAGDYSLLVFVPGLARFEGATFTLAPEGELLLPEVRLSPVPPIRGRVVDPDGRPAEGMSIVCEYTAPPSHPDAANHLREFGSATTDATGTFELDDVGGAVRLRIEADGVLPQIVPLPATGARDALVLEVPSTRAISGRIELPGGLPDVKIEIHGVAELSEARRRELADGSSRFMQFAEIEIERNGTFRLPKTPPTEFDLELWVSTPGSGTIVARRRISAGVADVELGTWRLANGAK